MRLGPEAEKELRSVLEELILGHAPIAEKHSANLDVLSGRNAVKAWSDDLARKALRILNGKAD